MIQDNNFSLFKQRRMLLLDVIKKTYPEHLHGLIVFVGAFEGERQEFRQHSSFFYFTGITEPASILTMDLNGKSTLFLPNFGKERKKWVTEKISLESDPHDFCIDGIMPLSDVAPGYSYNKRFHSANYVNFLTLLSSYLGNSFPIFGEYHCHTDALDQELFFDALKKYEPGISTLQKDVGPLIHELRRAKDAYEIQSLKKAIEVTISAQKNVAAMIKPGKKEHEIQANIEHTFIYEAAARPSFPSIVASGKNSTVLHYTDRNATIADGDLVVIDIGAEYNHYAADLTRTYPANGIFTPRQKEIYQAVLDTQEYIASLAKPGMFLRNIKKEHLSLHWLAVQYLKERGLAQYFPHGLGHYLGLEVHDVGSYDEPLKVGDVFTIEPGVYIPEEKLGVRIEDDYLIVEDGVICLSSHLPKTVHEIEVMMRGC